jgi:hypothetical protein
MAGGLAGTQSRASEALGSSRAFRVVLLGITSLLSQKMAQKLLARTSKLFESSFHEDLVDLDLS